MSDPAITVRVASRGDSRALELLAGSTGRSRPPAGTTLLAERDGVTLGAIGMTSGTVLTEPDSATVDTALRFTRYRVMRQAAGSGAVRSLLSHPAQRFTVPPGQL